MDSNLRKHPTGRPTVGIQAVFELSGDLLVAVFGGLVWSGLVWSGQVLSGLVWSIMVWCGLVWSGLVVVSSGLVWSGYGLLVWRVCGLV